MTRRALVIFLGLLAAIIIAIGIVGPLSTYGVSYP